MRIRWVVALALCATAAAAAERDELFGQRGRVLVSGAFSLTNTSTDAAGVSSLSTIVLSPAVQVFVAPEVALGVQLELARQSSGNLSITSFSLLPSVGYCVELGRNACLLPQFLMGVRIDDFGGTQTAFEIGAQAPLLFRPFSGFFFGFGPSIVAELTRSNSPGKLLTFGLQSILGGVF
jgi:hypothetical protein